MTDSINDAVENINNDMSTPSETAEPEVIEEAQEPEAENEVEEKPESTPESIAKKPRHRRTDAAIRDSESRILAEVDKRFQAMQTAAPTATNNVMPVGDVNPHAERQLTNFQGDVQAILQSDDDYDKQVAKTINDTSQGNNNLSDLSPECVSQLIYDGFTPDELHEINNRFADDIKPSTPDVEYRLMKRLRRQIKVPQVPKKVTKVAPKPTSTVEGAPVGARQRDAQYFYNRFRGK